MKDEYMKCMILFSMIFFLSLSSCMTSRPSNAIEELGEQVIKKKEGIDIRLMPIEEEKQLSQVQKGK
jgi:Ser-tRNA(Ala) deacylase AlaX